MALVLVIGVMFILLTLGTGTLYCGLQSRLLAVRDSERIVAKAAADAGLRKAIAQMDSYESGPLPSATDEAVPGCTASYGYTVVRNPDSTCSVTSTGTSGTAIRTVGSRLRRSSSLWSSVAIRGNVSLAAASRIKPLTPGDSLWLRTSSTSSGGISLASSSVVEGDITVGPGGDPASVVSLGGQSQITGSSSAAEQVLDFPVVTPPSGLPDRGDVQITSPQIISSSGQYSSLLIEGAAQVGIEGDITIYVTGNTTIRNSSQLLVRDGSRLTLYLGGNLSLNRGTIKEVNLRPERVHIYGTPTCTQITCTSSPDIYAAIYAPAANCTLNSSSLLVGVFSGNSLALSGASTLCYTEAVTEGCLYGTYTWRIDLWWEN
jgi:hypothetical protein